ncbi:MAG TPA: hypothetical protein VGK74_05185 [Symbiobacteriaceae bacterium]|jgi:hypothetical protein
MVGSGQDDFQEMHPELRTAREHFMVVLDDLCQHVQGVAKRREMLLLIPGLMDKVEQGMVMDAIIKTRGLVNSCVDIGSDSIAIVYNNGWALGFEGDGGELVILIDYIDDIRPNKTGLEINLETGETVYLRFLGRTAT